MPKIHEVLQSHYDMMNKATPEVSGDATYNAEIQADKISALVVVIGQHIRQLAPQYGAWKPGMRIRTSLGFDGANLPEQLAAVLLTDHEYVSVERVGDAWALMYRYIPALHAGGAGAKASPLKDASLDAKRAFLAVSRTFLENYLQYRHTAEELTERALTVGEETVYALDEMRLSREG